MASTERSAEPAAAGNEVRRARRIVLAAPVPPLVEPPILGPVTDPVGPPLVSPVADPAPHNGHASAVVEAPPVPIAPLPPVPAAPLPAPDNVAPDPEPVRAGRLLFLTRPALVRARALLLGALGVGLALYGQKRVVDGQILSAIHWYTLGLAVLLVAWLGTYRNKSLLRLPPLPVAAATPVGSAPLGLLARRPALRMVPRYVLALAALGLNLYSTTLIRAGGYDSLSGGLGWAASLVLLLVAFIGHRPLLGADADATVHEVEDGTDWQLSRRAETVLFLGIVLLTFALRLYRLDDWTMGVHGDEGEAGMDATNILEGHLAPLFGAGWFAQPNFYYWGVALGMKVFGVGLGGLRAFSTLTGSLMVVPLYFLVRRWFGVRTAAIASVFLAISAVTIHFTRAEFSNITAPLSLTLGFLFLARGLQTRRLLDWVLTGYGFMLGLYFYNGGRLNPFVVVGAVVYLFGLLPLARLPGVYRALRRAQPVPHRLRALGGALGSQVRSVALYIPQIIVLLLACVCAATPFAAYLTDNSAVLNGRANEKLIFNPGNEGRMVQQHQATHAPLYVGLRVPTRSDVYPFSPLVFEQTPLSVQVLRDGFWPRALWGQTVVTLSVFTYRWDASSVYTYTNAPVTKPIEAALLIIGLAWALWRWRDARLGLVSLWFWSTVIAGGVLTIDAPYMARIIGIVPAMAILTALPVSKLCAEFVTVFGRLGRSLRLRRLGQGLTVAATAAVLLALGVQNFSDYYIKYVAVWPFSEVTGQSAFVRDTNNAAQAAGRPRPFYYDVGAPLIFWGHGVNRFLNHGTDGTDLANAADTLPVLEAGDRDVVFMVWGLNAHYLTVLHDYYPEGRETPFYYGAPPNPRVLFTAYQIPREALAARRQLLASYAPATGPTVTRQEAGLGTRGTPPAGLTYPVQARWSGGLVAPEYGRYRFHLDSPAGGSLQIDNTPVLTKTVDDATSSAEVLLARGIHFVELRGVLPDAAAHVGVQWSAGGQAFTAVRPQFLWNGPGAALLGTIQPFSTNPWGAEPPQGAGAAPILQQRLDGFLGFRDAPTAFRSGSLTGRWSGILTVPQTGTYTFETYANGGTQVTLDDIPVISNHDTDPSVRSATGQVTLTAGAHRFEATYVYAGGQGTLELFWTPPGGARTLLDGTVLRAEAGGVWPVGTGLEPPPVTTPLGDPPVPVAPAKILAAPSYVRSAHSLAADGTGLIFIGDTEQHRIAVLDAAGNTVRTWGTAGTAAGQLGTIEDVAVGPDGKVYVLEAPDPDRVQVFNPDGSPDRIIKLQPSSAAGMTVGPDGAVYIADPAGNRIWQYRADGTFQTAYSGSHSPSNGLNQPIDAVVGGDGLLYVIDLLGRVVQLDPATDTIRKSWSVGIGTSFGASNLAGSGSLLYVTDPDRSVITVVDTASDRVDRVGAPGTGPGQFLQPVGVAVGRDGLVYVGDSGNGRIQVFSHLVPRQ
ncbi:MAG: PA14 domain-containing protein [Chloroflexota bacterium]|nr:PA14 domain-containing protein [Chloroflexota bacterium]